LADPITRATMTPGRPSGSTLGLAYGEVHTMPRRAPRGLLRALAWLLGSAVFWVPFVVFALALAGRP